MTDKQVSRIYFLLAVLCTIPLFLFKPERGTPVFKQDRANFKNGEILLPDYAHDDTVVVVNAVELNYAIDSTDIGTDAEIDSVLRLYTIPFQK